jgi:hypothetical protein
MSQIQVRHQPDKGLSFNIEGLSLPVVRNLLKDLSPRVLTIWMSYFIEQEKYEVCQMIKEALAEKRFHA